MGAYVGARPADAVVVIVIVVICDSYSETLVMTKPWLAVMEMLYAGGDSGRCKDALENLTNLTSWHECNSAVNRIHL